MPKPSLQEQIAQCKKLIAALKTENRKLQRATAKHEAQAFSLKNKVIALEKELRNRAYLKFCVGGHIISIKGELNDRQHQSLQAPAAQI